MALPVTLRVGKEPPTVVHGSTVDFSHRGMRIRANHPFEPNQNLEVQFGHNGNHPKNYTVVWVRDPARGKPIYETGLAVQD